MKQKLKEAWYFTQWLFKHIDWLYVTWFIMMASSVAVWYLPDEVALPLCFIVIVYGFCMMLYLLIYKPLTNAYARYKQEQRDIFNTIRNSK